MVGRPTGKVALVANGSSAIGRSAALAFARAGARVVVCARREDKGEETARVARNARGEAIDRGYGVIRQEGAAAVLNPGSQRVMT